ncbi:T9SS type A sorting domain-containing protein [Mariniflexile sp.]|uniref:T9SS type A sorting domain-containing protein n=1 Tax=Mariniflexile sp. TaxID=1979402 RepID=UPI003565FCE8
MNFNLTIIIRGAFPFFLFLFGKHLIAQSITVNTANVKQKIEFVGADFERSQNFVQKALNPDDIIEWAFKDINFNICRVAYDKVQKTENYKFEVEANNISGTGTYVQWQLIDAGNGYYYIKNVASNTNLQCIDTKTVDNGGNLVYSRPASSCTGSWCKWELVESTISPGYYNIRNVGLNKYLQCTSDVSANTGLFVRAVDVNIANSENDAALWSISQQGNSTTTIFIDNKGFQKRLRYTDIDEVVENMAFYDDAILTMKAIKAANPDVKFLATMRSDYNGYNSDNRNNLPEYIYNYSCVEANEEGKCIRTLGNSAFNTDAFGIFLADYLELMHTNGLTISYLATAKEWTVVTAQRSHDTYLKLVSECANRGIPVPEIIAPASWSLSQGINYANQVADLGFQDEYHSFSSHNLNSQDELFSDFANAASAIGKKAWNDESSAGGGSRTQGVNPDLSLAIDAYIEKTKQYEGGLVGECFFEINSRGVDSETRTIYFKNNTEAKRLRSYYIMKDFANNIVDKNYIQSTISSLTNVHTMAFGSDHRFTLVVINDGESDINNLPIHFNNVQLNGNIQESSWVNTSNDEGDKRVIIKENASSFKTDIRAKSINIYTINDTSSLSANSSIVKNAATIYPNPVSDDLIQVAIDDSYFNETVVFSISDLSGRIVKKGILEKTKTINIGKLSKEIYLLKLEFKSIKQTFKIAKN